MHVSCPLLTNYQLLRYDQLQLDSIMGKRLVENRRNFLTLDDFGRSLNGVFNQRSQEEGSEFVPPDPVVILRLLIRFYWPFFFCCLMVFRNLSKNKLNWISCQHLPNWIVPLWHTHLRPGFREDNPETWNKLSETETGRYYDACPFDNGRREHVSNQRRNGRVWDLDAVLLLQKMEQISTEQIDSMGK